MPLFYKLEVNNDEELIELPVKVIEGSEFLLSWIELLQLVKDIDEDMY